MREGGSEEKLKKKERYVITRKSSERYKEIEIRKKEKEGINDVSKYGTMRKSSGRDSYRETKN